MRALILAAVFAGIFAIPALAADGQFDLATHAPPPAVTYSGAVRGNLASHIYFWPGCPNYDQLRPEHRIEFASAGAAQHAGYRAARNCNRFGQMRGHRFHP